MSDEVRYLRALLMAAPQFQGGHSDVGMEISEVLEIGFPLSMDSLRACAISHDFMPYDLWPWLERMSAPTRTERNSDAQ